MSQELPRDTGIDNTLKVLSEGYHYIMNRQDRFDSDVFETRLLGKQTICMVGEEAAEIFYDEDKFKREGAAPNRVKQTLFGEGGVQGMDGESHRNRKQMFMQIMTKKNLEKFNEALKQQWELALEKWQNTKRLSLYEENQKILTKAAFTWAGVPMDDNMENMTEDVASLFETPASFGPPHWMGRRNRNKLEKWMTDKIKAVREGELNPPAETALYEFSWHKDLDGKYLDSEIVAVEVLNIIRPIVANSVYINFLVIALNDYPEEIEKLRTKDSEYARMFIQETRRYYPFFPFVTAIVKKDFTWKDYKFEEGTMTLLDLYGTNHHPTYWKNPEVFNPERFRDWEASPFAFIPQGGGDYSFGHRCAGEGITMEVMKVALDYLINHMVYDLPAQDLKLEMNDIPSVPKDKIIIENVSKI